MSEIFQRIFEVNTKDAMGVDPAATPLSRVKGAVGNLRDVLEAIERDPKDAVRQASSSLGLLRRGKEELQGAFDGLDVESLETEERAVLGAEVFSLYGGWLDNAGLKLSRAAERLTIGVLEEHGQFCLDFVARSIQDGVKEKTGLDVPEEALPVMVEEFRRNLDFEQRQALSAKVAEVHPDQVADFDRRHSEFVQAGSDLKELISDTKKDVLVKAAVLMPERGLGVQNEPPELSLDIG